MIKNLDKLKRDQEAWNKVFPKPDKVCEWDNIEIFVKGKKVEGVKFLKYKHLNIMKLNLQGI